MSSRGSTGPMQTITPRRNRNDEAVILNQSEILRRVKRIRNRKVQDRVAQILLTTNHEITAYMLHMMIREASR